MIDACILAMPYGFCSFGQRNFRAFKEGGGEEEEKSFISLLTIASIPHRFRSVASVKEDISEGLVVLVLFKCLTLHHSNLNH